MNWQKAMRREIRRAWKDPAWPAPEGKDDWYDHLFIELVRPEIVVFVVGITTLLVCGFDAEPPSWFGPLIPLPLIGGIGIFWALVRRRRYTASNFSRALGVQRIRGRLLCRPYTKIWRKASRSADGSLAALLLLLCETGSLELLQRARLGAESNAEDEAKQKAHLRRTRELAAALAHRNRLKAERDSAERALELRLKAQLAPGPAALHAFDSLALAADEVIADLKVEAAGLEGEVEALEQAAGSQETDRST